MNKETIHTSRACFMPRGGQIPMIDAKHEACYSGLLSKLRADYRPRQPGGFLFSGLCHCACFGTPTPYGRGRDQPYKTRKGKAERGVPYSESAPGRHAKLASKLKNTEAFMAITITPTSGALVGVYLEESEALFQAFRTYDLAISATPGLTPRSLRYHAALREALYQALFDMNRNPASVQSEAHHVH